MIMQHRFLLFFLFAFFLTCCSNKSKKSIEIVHFDMEADLIITEIIKTILEKQLGYSVKLTSATPAAAWAAVGSGMADIALGVWLPQTHGSYYENVKNNVEILNRMTEGVKIGIAIPEYIPCTSLQDLKLFGQKFGKKIYGIDPGAGIMICCENAISKYGITDFEIVEGSEALMLVSLLEAIKKKEWIAVTAWNPHPMFQMVHLKYLEDPEYVFNEEEFIAILGRKNLFQDLPDAYSFLSHFKLTQSDIEQMQYSFRFKNATIKDLASEWIAVHQQEIDEWL
jgi:glycine betaine/proline transport system substrate-binding protein